MWSKERKSFALGYAYERRELSRELREIADNFDAELVGLRGELHDLRTAMYRDAVLKAAAAAESNEPPVVLH
jgi:hypothetical protein